MNMLNVEVNVDDAARLKAILRDMEGVTVDGWGWRPVAFAAAVLTRQSPRAMQAALLDAGGWRDEGAIAVQEVEE